MRQTTLLASGNCFSAAAVVAIVYKNAASIIGLT
jgi:hypothetical protein